MIARESSVLPADHDQLTMPERYIRCDLRPVTARDRVTLFLTPESRMP